MNRIILSMATMPCRKHRLIENLPSIFDQTQNFDLLVLNINNNVTVEDMAWYNELPKQYDKIVIVRGDDKWKSCNKLLPTLKTYPEDIIITVDDDVYYPKDCIKYLIEEYKKHPHCIIAHEINPIIINDNKISYLNGFDIKLKQLEWGKYLSNCTLYPPHVFDNTDLFDYDKMMYCTNGTHDELWFWINSTLNGVQCIGLNYIKSFFTEMKTPWGKNEYKLADINLHQSAIDDYMNKIHEMYGERLLEQINKKKTLFVLTCDNIIPFLHEVPYITHLYKYGIEINTNELTNHWKLILKNVLNGGKFTY